jgi:hypothetical protein
MQKPVAGPDALALLALLFLGRTLALVLTLILAQVVVRVQLLQLVIRGALVVAQLVFP